MEDRNMSMVDRDKYLVASILLNNVGVAQSEPQVRERNYVPEDPRFADASEDEDEAPRFHGFNDVMYERNSLRETSRANQEIYNDSSPINSPPDEEESSEDEAPNSGLILHQPVTPLYSNTLLSLLPLPRFHGFNVMYEGSSLCETSRANQEIHNDSSTMTSPPERNPQENKRARCTDDNEHYQDVSESPEKKKKRGRGRPKGSKLGKDFPKKNLTAYNLFFRDERQRLLASIEACSDESTSTAYKRKGRPDPHRKISFSELGKIIGQKWKNIPADTRAKYDEMALEEKRIYQEKVKEYRSKKEKGLL